MLDQFRVLDSFCCVNIDFFPLFGIMIPGLGVVRRVSVYSNPRNASPFFIPGSRSV